MKHYLPSVLILISLSCTNPACQWKGGAITEYGKYCNDSINIEVDEENNLLKFAVRNSEGRMLIEPYEKISTVQHWGLFLDNSGNFWVFSSDIGHSFYERSSLTGDYLRKELPLPLTKESVPPELYSSPMKRFVDMH